MAHRTAIRAGAWVWAAAAIASISGCTTSLESRRVGEAIGAEKPVKGVVYYLPRAEYQITVSRELRSCTLGYLRREYVTGIAVGYAMKAGDYIGELAIRIHVEKKREKATLTKAQCFPERILGIRVDVIEMTFEHQNALTGASPLVATGFRPGARIETGTGQIGSIGLIVQRKSDQKLFALSAAHVLGSAGIAVFCPDRTAPSHQIGDVTEVLGGVLDAGIVDIGDRQFSNQPMGSNQQIKSVKMVDNKEILSFSGMRGLDPAFIRRFDMVFELPIPPKTQRERILQSSCGELLDANQISRIAEAEALAPAVVAKASSVIRLIQDDLGPRKTAAALERLISSTMEAQGHGPLLSHDANRLPEVYDPGFIHADVDLAAVAAGLVAARSGRLCLYGPPGTGKTAYGRWLAQQLGVPLLVKRASDLKSKWLGESEKNIAKAFRDAQNDAAVLLIDEVDSFLQDRRGAQHNWEVSEVNGMLTQMESFSGVFVASTNLMEGLDQAALRRFDLKVKFDFLRANQAWALLSRHCKGLGLPQPQPEEQARISRLVSLTPGDFAAVVRQHRFRPIASAADLVAALEAECAVKHGTNRAIGFL